MTIETSQLDALRRWLRSAGSAFADVEAAAQLKGGQSNPTYRLDTGAGPVVLRKQPRGASKWAHDVRREHTVLSALKQTDVLTPTPYEFCDDASILGGDFYLMEFIDGRIIDDCRLFDAPREQRQAIYRSFTQAVAQLHSVDYQAIGLASFGKPKEFVSRQIALHGKLFQNYQPAGEPNMAWLEKTLPRFIPSGGTFGVVNNDIRLGNAVLDATEPRVISLLDWEMATIADTRVDASLLLLPYYLPSNHPQGSFRNVAMGTEGLPLEEEILAAYGEADTQLQDMVFFIVFNLYRYASVSAGIAHRLAQGIAVADDAARYGPTVTPTARAAVELARNSFARDVPPPSDQEAC